VSWFSLFPVEKVVACSFLLFSQGEEETNPLIWTFIKGQENRIDNELTLPECYISFLHSYMSFVTKLEARATF
jgi:hypothetical protein